MKKNFLLVLALAAASAGLAQIRKIPSETTQALEKMFKGATEISWKDNVTNFEANFKYNGHETSAQFSGKGEWKETVTKLSMSEVPAEVMDGFKKSTYADWDTGDSSYKIEQPEGYLRYRIYVKKGLEKKYLFFNKDGKLEKTALTI